MKKMMFLSKNWYFNKSRLNSFILLVFSHVANFRYVANFRFLTLLLPVLCAQLTATVLVPGFTLIKPTSLCDGVPFSGLDEYQLHHSNKDKD